MSKKDGGPSIPYGEKYVSDGAMHTRMVGGLSLRDYFAGQALQRLISVDLEPAAATAEWAYVYADAMLAARENGDD